MDRRLAHLKHPGYSLVEFQSCWAFEMAGKKLLARFPQETCKKTSELRPRNQTKEWILRYISEKISNGFLRSIPHKNASTVKL